MKKITFRRSIYEWLTAGFVVTFRHEENFALKWSYRLNYAKLIVFGILIFGLLFLLNFFMITRWLDFWFDPRESRAQTELKLLNLNMAVDSLETEMAMKDTFIFSLKQMFGDYKPVNTSLKNNQNSLSDNKRPDNLNEVSDAEEKLRKEFESIKSEGQHALIGMESGEFSLPVSGYISSDFDPATKHYGIDIVSKDKEPIRSIAAGTVILADWTKETGYSLVIQHPGKLMSVYKHNSLLLKKSGNIVRSGEIIAVIGNTGTLTSGPHLHLEIWHEGKPVNPQKIIHFK